MVIISDYNGSVSVYDDLEKQEVKKYVEEMFSWQKAEVLHYEEIIDGYEFLRSLRSE